MELYLEALNKIGDLENSLGVRIMLFGKVNNIPMIDLQFNPPLAPRLKGKKLVAKTMEAVC